MVYRYVKIKILETWACLTNNEWICGLISCPQALLVQWLYFSDYLQLSFRKLMVELVGSEQTCHVYSSRELLKVKEANDKLVAF